MKKLIALCVLLVSFAGVARAATVILKLKMTNGEGSLVKNIKVFSDGTAVALSLKNNDYQVIDKLTASEIGSIEHSINAIQRGPLVRTNPNQFYNPGGFAVNYILTNANGQTFAFAENISGVDFGISGAQDGNLIILLQKLASIPVKD